MLLLNVSTFSFVCPICGNKDPNAIGIRNGKPYCRKCLSFRGQEVQGSEGVEKDAFYSLDYDLSEEQAELSLQLLRNFKAHKNSLVHAVCGSGKTEIVLKVIAYAVSMGLKVGFAVPRRDVVIELYSRFHHIFKANTIALVYGGHAQKLDGDLICCTTHQLFRYEHYFDLLVLDEVDAFPFNGNDVLNAFFKRSIKRNYILMSATPSVPLIEDFKKDHGEVVELFSRFHRYPLPVPEPFYKQDVFLIMHCIRLIRLFNKKGKQVFVFAPTIKICEELYDKIHYFCPHGAFVHSKCSKRGQIISDFRKKRFQFLVTTAVLERGVTVKDLQVIVYRADHPIYNSSTLVQISGRVGRKKEAPEGRVIFLANEETEHITQSIRAIETANKNMQNLFKTYSK